MNHESPETSMIFEKPVQDYLRIATASPEVAIADPVQNFKNIMVAYRAAEQDQAELLALPELAVTGYSSADMFFNRQVLEKAEMVIGDLAAETLDGPAMVVGAPLRDRGVLYNCGVVLAEGKIQGVVPKSYLPIYGEFYEKRWFTSGSGVEQRTITIDGHEVPFGTDLIFNVNGTAVGVEVCEDAWAPITPSAHAALQGAEVIVNLSASNELVGKAEYRKEMVSSLASKLICAYAYTSSGDGESTADIVFGGHQMIIENGRLMGEIKELTDGKVVVDVDVSDIRAEREVNKTFGDQAAEERAKRTFRAINLQTTPPDDDRLLRYVDPHPFVPSNPETLDMRCEQIFNMMARQLARRVEEVGTQALVIGLSGGLDSTLALLTAVYTCQILGKDNSFIHTITMPGMASSERTQDNATLLAEALGTTHKVIPISTMSEALLGAIGHDQATEDLTYENTQARMRTSILMNYSNLSHGFVVGTGDLSETAQGWCTYNGDHMSMFNPNSSVPKTLVRHLVNWFADKRTEGQATTILKDILDTPVSPELTGKGDLTQTTEDILGPYELHDFFLYYLKRRSSRPAKIGYLATKAFEGVYDEPTIDKWLGSFLKRFTGSQWKRDVMPNGPKIGTVSLSPRGDHRMAPNTSQGWYK